MPAYLLFIREDAVVDPDELAIYARKNREAPRDPALKPLVVYGAIEALEGKAADGVVLLEFPDTEAARRWYRSPAYQAAIPHRQKAAPYRAMLIEGL